MGTVKTMALRTAAWSTALAALLLSGTASADAPDPSWKPPTSPPSDTGVSPDATGEDATRGSLITHAPFGAGNVGMAMGGGVAVLLPFYGLGVGVGLSDRVDLVARFETVIGVFHFPHLGIRWSPVDIGSWRLGTRLLFHYSFFGIETDQVNLTSTFYTSAQLGISGPVTDETELIFSVDGEFDFFEYRVVDDEGDVFGTYRYDATVVRVGAQTDVSDDFDGYAQLRLRIPTETFQFEAQQLYVIPLLEIGGTWSF